MTVWKLALLCLAAPLATMAVLAVTPACNGKTSGGSTTYPSCVGAATSGQGSAVCAACMTSICTSQVAALNSDCGSVVTCVETTQCSNESALDTCIEFPTAACSPALAAVISCQDNFCQSECETEVSVTVTVPTVSEPPAGFVAPDGIVIGGTVCDGDVYIAYDGAYVFCDDGVWEYTTTDPGEDGYAIEAFDSGDDDSGTGGDDSSDSDDGGASDSTAGDDSSDSDDGGASDSTG